MGRREHFEGGADPESTYRGARAMPSSSVPGVEYVDHKDIPPTILTHHDMLGVNNDKHGEL